jgi:hypothetical protein
MKTNRCWLIALAVLALTACEERPTEPEDAELVPVAVFGKPDGPPGGGKPQPPSEDIPLRVFFHEDGTGIRSDGDPEPEYVHGQDFVSAIIRDNGMLFFQAFDGKKKDEDDPARRDVEVNLELTPWEIFEPDHLNAFKNALVEAGDSWPVFTSDVTLHTRDSSGGMYTMVEGTTLLDAGKIGFNDYGDASWEWRLLFGARVETPEGGVDHYEDGLCITHPDEDTWVVRNYGEDCAFEGVTELWRLWDGDFIHVADFTTPMHLTLTKK